MKSEYAEVAIQKMTGQKIANKTLLCKLSNSSSANNAEPSDNLYIKPLLATTSTGMYLFQSIVVTRRILTGIP